MGKKVEYTNGELTIVWHALGLHSGVFQGKIQYE